MLRCLFKAALSSIRCKGCFQPETWDFDSGKVWTPIEEEKILSYVQNPIIKRFSILGGEPLEPFNWYELNQLLDKIKNKRPDIKIWLYTGYTYEYIKKQKNELLQDLISKIDYLVAGPFIEELKDLGLKFRGSSNQVIYNLHE